MIDVRFSDNWIKERYYLNREDFGFNMTKNELILLAHIHVIRLCHI